MIIHLAGVGGEFERVVDPKTNHVALRHVRIVRYPTKTLCGVLISSEEYERKRTVMVWGDDSSCRECLRLSNQKTVEYLQPIRLG